MAPIEDDPVCADEGLDDDDESEEEEVEYLVTPAKRLDEIDEVDEDPDQDNDTSSSNLVSGEPILPNHSSPQLTLAVSVAADQVSALQAVTIALPTTDSSPDFKRQRIDALAIPAINKTLKPPAGFEESRRLFQRLWTDEDEIELLQGFLDYTKRRRFNSGSGNAYHHDTSAFYEQIKSKLQLDFNKNQLVEKLRRLKKKYTTVISKVGSGKEYVFKSSHDQATFEICKKIWSTDTETERGGGLEDNDANPPTTNNPNSMDNRHVNNSSYPYSSGTKSSGSGKRSRGGSVKLQEVKPQFHQLTTPTTATCTPTPTVVTGSPSPSSIPIPIPIPSLIEDTVRSCLPPLLKDLLQNCGPSCSGGGLRGGINPLPFGLLVGGSLNSSLASGGGGGDVMEEKWRKQQILELEVYSKRLELVQDEIKSALDELRSFLS